MVKSAIVPVFGAVDRSLLSTPQLDQWSRVSGMWTGSLVVANSVFVLMVVIAGLTLMGHQSLQTSYTVKDIAQRLVLGVVLANMSLLLIGKAIYAANGLSAALVSQGVNVDQAANQMSKIVTHAVVNPGDVTIFLQLVALVAVVLGLILLIMYLVRMSLTIGAATLGDTFIPQLTLSLNIDYLRAVLPGTAYTVRAESSTPARAAPWSTARSPNRMAA